MNAPIAEPSSPGATFCGAWRLADGRGWGKIFQDAIEARRDLAGLREEFTNGPFVQAGIHE